MNPNSHPRFTNTLCKQNQPLIDPSKIDKDSDHESIIASQYEQSTKQRNNNTNNSHSTRMHKTLTNETISTSRRSVALDMDDI